MALKIISKIFYTVALLFATLIFWPIFIFSLLFLLLSIFYRTFVVWPIAKIFRPDLRGFLTKGNSGFALYPNTIPHKSVNIIVSGYVNGQISVDRVCELFHERILHHKNGKNKLIYKRLSHTWTNFMGFAFWKTEKSFDVANHVRKYDYGGDMSLPTPCTQKNVENILGKLVESPWKKNQSPWEILTINDFLEGGNSEFKTYFIFRIDHALTDGYSIQGLFKQLFQTKFSVPRINLNGKKLSIWGKLGLVFKIPFDCVNILWVFASARKFYKRKLSKNVVCSISPTVPVSMIKEIKNHFKVSYAAVLHSAVQGAIFRMLTLAKKNVPKNICCNFVLPLPNHPGGMVVHATMIGTLLPCKASSPAERLIKTHEKMMKLKNSTAGLGLFLFAKMEGYYPTIVRRNMLNAFNHTGISYAITNFPVTTEPDYFDGLELMDLMGTVGTYQSLGMVVATGGTNNKQRIAFTIDQDVFGCEDICKIGEFVGQELEALAQEMV